MGIDRRVMRGDLPGHCPPVMKLPKLSAILIVALPSGALAADTEPATPARTPANG